MKQVAHYNKLTDFLKNYLDAHRLKEGEVRTYQALWGKPNLDDDPKEVARQPVFYNNHQIPTRDVIVCPQTKARVEIGWVDIGEGDKAVLKNFYPAYERMQQFRYNGIWTLRGDVVEEVELDEYLLLCSFRQPTADTAAWRNKSKEELFEVKDYKADSLKSATTRSLKRNAMNKAAQWREERNLEAARDFAASLNWAYQPEAEILLDAVEAYAENNPQAFLHALEAPVTAVKAVVKKALDAGILAYEPNSGQFKQGATLLASFPQSKPGFDYLQAAAEWLTTTPNGAKILDSIQKKVKTAAEKKLPA